MMKKKYGNKSAGSLGVEYLFGEQRKTKAA